MNDSSSPLWNPHPTIAPPARSVDGRHVDVAIIGAGITGLTAATLLRERGKTVAILDDRGVANGETGHTTAHITEAIDARFHAVKRRFGVAGASVVAKSLRAAIDTIEARVTSGSIDCAFRRLPGYLFTEQRGRIAPLKNEAAAAKEAGVAASFVPEIPLPFATRGAVRFDNQAQFHPVAYAKALAAPLSDELFLGVHVTSVEDGEPCVIETNAGRMTAEAVFLATNAPLNDVFATGLKIAAYRSYVLAASWSGARPDGLFWDTDDPYHYIRWHDDAVIVGGEDHKVGQETETSQCFERLQSWTAQRMAGLQPAHQWSGQIIEPSDGLPFIGLKPGSAHVYLATGYSGQGMTFGTYGAMLVTDLITGAKSELSEHARELFSPSRMALSKETARENVDFPKEILRDKLRLNVETKRLLDVPPGEGKIVSVEGRKLAVARDGAGVIHALNPTCTHLGCDVAWNQAESSWDCPCHGSRFSTEGHVLNGPATKPLPRVRVDDTE